MICSFLAEVFTQVTPHLVGEEHDQMKSADTHTVELQTRTVPHVTQPQFASASTSHLPLKQHAAAGSPE